MVALTNAGYISFDLANAIAALIVPNLSAYALVIVV